MVWGQGDDGLDIDQAYAGTISNAIVILNQASDHALEIDGPEGSATGSFNLNNLTLIGTTMNVLPQGLMVEQLITEKGLLAQITIFTSETSLKEKILS